jgi:hypothetical protein
MDDAAGRLPAAVNLNDGCGRGGDRIGELVREISEGVW